MDERTKKWLMDILLSIQEIESFMDGKPKIFAEYQKNILLKRGIERNLEIIGEAMNRILKQNSSYTDSISEAKSIIALRNLVIHSYDSISDENIWSIVLNHLPKLKIEIQELLGE